MPKLLLAPEQRGWPHFQRLMIALLSFLEPYLRNADLTEAIRMLYKVGPLPANPGLKIHRVLSMRLLQSTSGCSRSPAQLDTAKPAVTKQVCTSHD